MTIPETQFHLFYIDQDPFFYQTYEEALKRACDFAKSTEFIDLDPDEVSAIRLYFPKANREITIHSKLFTYNRDLPLVTNRYGVLSEQKKYECRNLLV